MIATFSASSKFQGFFFRIFALWRLNVFGKICLSSVESKIFLIKNLKIHLETTKLEPKKKKTPAFQWMMTTLATNKNSWKKHLPHIKISNLVEIP
jgi:hypothetical protein